MKKFVNLYELFGNIFNRHFKSYYYNEDIANMFQYDNSLFFKNFNIYGLSRITVFLEIIHTGR